jgi:hypothetical protein
MDNNIVRDESLAGRVRRILDDMAFVRAALVAVDAQTGATPPPLELQLAAQMKSGVDSMRQVLWLYMRARCGGAGTMPQQMTDWYKTELAAEMLRLMRSRPTRADVQGNVVEMIPFGSEPPFRQGEPHA